MCIKKKRRSAFHIAQLGLLFCLAICFSFLEGALPAILPLPGVKIGLSNVVTMYTLFVLGTGQALLLTVLKALFALGTRGVVASMLSFSGGLFSIAAMRLLLYLLQNRTSYAGVSMAGAIAHNLGQLIVAAAILNLRSLFWYYLPFMLIFGVIMGLLTAALLRAAMPYLLAQQKRIDRME